MLTVERAPRDCDSTWEGWGAELPAVDIDALRRELIHLLQDAGYWPVVMKENQEMKVWGFAKNEDSSNPLVIIDDGRTKDVLKIAVRDAQGANREIDRLICDLFPRRGVFFMDAQTTDRQPSPGTEVYAIKKMSGGFALERRDLVDTIAETADLDGRLVACGTGGNPEFPEEWS
ncbi:hypothetical protein OAO01_04910 [Oligoflexia bacterium]|nr:hypothetical protein [Oligoflexia bacterium]